MLQALEKRPYDLSSLRAVPCGGSAVPPSLLERFDRLGHSSLPFQQECGHVETGDAAGVELERVPPVLERALDVAEAGPRLTAQLDQRGVLRSESEPLLDDRERLRTRPRVLNRRAFHPLIREQEDPERHQTDEQQGMP